MRVAVSLNLEPRQYFDHFQKTDFTTMRTKYAAATLFLLTLSACDNAVEALMPVVHPIEVQSLFGIVTTTLHNTGKSGEFYFYIEDGTDKKCFQRAFLAYNERKQFTFTCPLKNTRYTIRTKPELLAKRDKEFMALVNAGT